MWQNDLFYKISELDFNTKSKILNYAFEHSYLWHADKLVGWRRQRQDVSFDFIIDKFKHNSHFVVIHRRGLLEAKDDEVYRRTRWCGEIGFTSMDLKDEQWYLFIYISEYNLRKLVKKFGLSLMSLTG